MLNISDLISHMSRRESVESNPKDTEVREGLETFKRMYLLAVEVTGEYPTRADGNFYNRPRTLDEKIKKRMEATGELLKLLQEVRA